MADNDWGGAGNVLVAFMVGAIVGVAVGLLLAPVAGQEAREQVSQRAREGRDRAADALRKGREFVDRERGELTTAFERAREKFHERTGGDEEPQA